MLVVIGCWLLVVELFDVAGIILLCGICCFNCLLVITVCLCVKCLHYI